MTQDKPKKSAESLKESLHEITLEIDASKHVLSDVIANFEKLATEQLTDIKVLTSDMKDAYYNLKKIPENIDREVSEIAPQLQTYFFEKEKRAAHALAETLHEAANKLETLHKNISKYHLWKDKVAYKMWFYAILAGAMAGYAFSYGFWYFGPKSWFHF